MGYNSLVTVIVVTRNDEVRLLRTLASLTRKGRFSGDVIVVNGGREIVINRGLAARFSKLRIIRDEGDGIYHAMNRGIEEATTRWLWFLNCGDELVGDDALSDVSEEIDKDIGLIFYRYIKGNQSRRSVRWQQVAELYLVSGFVCHQAVVFRRDAVMEAQGYRLRWRYLADKDLIRRIMRIGWRARTSSRCLVRWETIGECTRNQIAFDREVREYRREWSIILVIGSWLLVKLEMIAEVLFGV